MEEQRKVLFEAKDLCKEFGPTIALNHVDLTVYGGEIRGLIGENGSGKSTISSIAAGMQPATSGEMFFEGKPHKPASMLALSANGVRTAPTADISSPGVSSLRRKPSGWALTSSSAITVPTRGFFRSRPLTPTSPSLCPITL